jgi:hypothetical protein
VSVAKFAVVAKYGRIGTQNLPSFNVTSGKEVVATPSMVRSSTVVGKGTSEVRNGENHNIVP